MGSKLPKAPIDPFGINKKTNAAIDGFFKKPKAPPEDPATIAARQEQIAQLGKLNDQQNYMVKKLMLAQRGFRPFGAPAPISQTAAGGASVFGGPAAPPGAAGTPAPGGGGMIARAFGNLRARGAIPGNVGGNR